MTQSTKLILLVYVPNYTHDEDIIELKKLLTKINKVNDLNATFFVIPSSEHTDIKMECINPQYLSEDDYLKEITPMLDRLKIVIDNAEYYKNEKKKSN